MGIGWIIHPYKIFAKHSIVVGRAGFEFAELKARLAPALLRHTGFCLADAYFSGCMLDRLGDAHYASRRLQRLHHAMHCA